MTTEVTVVTRFVQHISVVFWPLTMAKRARAAQASTDDALRYAQLIMDNDHFKKRRQQRKIDNLTLGSLVR